jgi:type IV pilus assembly protein PilF
VKKIFVILSVTVLLLSGCATSQWRQEKAEVHLNIASAYMGSNQYALALKELLDAEKLTPKDPKVHYFLGMTYYAKELHENAMEEFKIALDLKPDYSDVHSFIGTIHFNHSQWDKAIDSFNKALANPLYPTPAVALYNMGRAYFGKGQYQNAIKKYQEAKAKDPYSVPLFLITQHTGIAFLYLGDAEQAVTHLKYSLSLAPSLLESHYWLGQAYLKLSRHQDAVSAFQTYLKEAPDSDLAQKAKIILRDLNGYRR